MYMVFLCFHVFNRYIIRSNTTIIDLQNTVFLARTCDRYSCRNRITRQLESSGRQINNAPSVGILDSIRKIGIAYDRILRIYIVLVVVAVTLVSILRGHDGNTDAVDGQTLILVTCVFPHVTLDGQGVGCPCCQCMICVQSRNR